MQKQRYLKLSLASESWQESSMGNKIQILLAFYFPQMAHKSPKRLSDLWLSAHCLGDASELLSMQSQGQEPNEAVPRVCTSDLSKASQRSSESCLKLRFPFCPSLLEILSLQIGVETDIREILVACLLQVVNAKRKGLAWVTHLDVSRAIPGALRPHTSLISTASVPAPIRAITHVCPHIPALSSQHRLRTFLSGLKSLLSWIVT